MQKPAITLLVAVVVTGFFARTTVAQQVSLAYSLFSGDGPGNFNFDDFGAIQSVTLDPGGVSVSGTPTTLAQGGAGDSAFFFDATNAGDLFIANSNQGTLVDGGFSPVGGVAPGDVTGVAVDEINGFVFFTSRAGTGEVFRAPLNANGTIGTATSFLSGLNAPSSLHLTSGSRLLVGESGVISAVDPNNAATLTTLVTDVPGQTRGLEEDPDNGFIYYTTDDADDLARADSGGGASTVIFDGGGSFQDIVLDEVNSRIILANFAVDEVFDVDGQILTYGLDRAAGTLTDTGVTLLDQAGIADPVTQNAYFTGLSLLVDTAGPLLGDGDGDGDVDGDDLIAVQTNFGSVTPPPGDADGDGDVDGDDLIAVQTNFGATASAAVPEPTSVALAAMIAMGVAARDRVGRRAR